MPLEGRRFAEKGPDDPMTAGEYAEAAIARIQRSSSAGERQEVAETMKRALEGAKERATTETLRGNFTDWEGDDFDQVIERINAYLES